MSSDYSLIFLSPRGKIDDPRIEQLFHLLSTARFTPNNPYDNLVHGIDSSGTGELLFERGEQASTWLKAASGTITLWAGKTLDIGVGVQRVDDTLKRELANFADTAHFDVVTVSGRLADLEFHSPEMESIWRMIPSINAALDSVYSILVPDHLIEQQIKQWTLHDSLRRNELPKVTGVIITIPNDSPSMTRQLRTASEIPGCHLVESHGQLSLHATQFPADIPTHRWLALLNWAQNLHRRPADPDTKHG